MKEKKELIRAIKFAVISVSAGIIQIGAFALFNDALKWNYWLAYLFALTLSVLWNFTVNRNYTFKASNNIAKAMCLVALFYVVFTPLSTYLGNLATERGAQEYLVLLVTMLANFVLEFLYTRCFVYRNACDTKESKKS